MIIPKTYGRMGNFLFQAAAAIAYGAQHGIPVTVPNSTLDAFWNPIYLQHLVRTDFNLSLETVLVEEQQEFHYRPIPFREEWRNGNILLDGYWQNEGYFKGYRKEILEAFNFPWSLRTGNVSVHVRRGDYLTIQRNGIFKHPAVTKEWIQNQMKKFPDYHFTFFSDDIAWCMKEFGGRDDCHFSRQKSEVDDLVALSRCEHHICSASTFSWWGAWLNHSSQKRVIMPKHWLTPGWNGHNFTEEIVPKEWERA